MTQTSNILNGLLSIGIVVGVLVQPSPAQKKTPERGFRPAGSYAFSDIETISTTSGNMMLKMPLAALPPGRGGLSASLNLLYNSKLYDQFPTNTYVNQSYYDVMNLTSSPAGGWRYGYKYELDAEGRYVGVDEYGVEIGPCTVSNYTIRPFLITPDGNKHVLRLAGHMDGDGYQDVSFDGRPTCSGSGVSSTLSFYTTDGTFLRLDVQHDSDSNMFNNPWTLFLPDGGRVTGGDSNQKVYDRNNNYIEIINTTYNSHAATKLQDELGRYIMIEYESATNQDTIHVTGYNGAALNTTVAWTNVVVHKAYSRGVGTPFNFSPAWRSVSQITLPSQASSLTYLFTYNADGSNPTVGWGELNSITLSSGAKSNYAYLQDNQNNISNDSVLQNRPTQKQLVYRLEYDGNVSNSACTSGCTTETWTYGITYADAETPVSSTVTGPDGGVSTDYFNKNEDGTLNQSGLVYKSVAPDGTVTERYWQTNIPYTSSYVFNETFYPKYEFTSVPNPSGTPVQTAIKEISNDKNGNVTRVASYDWAAYGNVPRNGQGRPYGLPSGAVPKTVTVNAYYNPTPDASNTTTNDSDSFHIAGSPRLHQSLESSEVLDGNNTRFSRSEVSYDYTATVGVVGYPIGNPTQQRRWDNTKGSFSSPPITSGNGVITSTTYDGYGNPLTTTDARGTQTQLTYGSINGYSGLYPTITKIAYGTSVQRHSTTIYDFYTGVGKETKDEDNNVTTVTSYDDLARPTLVTDAYGKSEETRTLTEYSDADRRVIVKADLNTADYKLVSIKHYDQLGRLRLARQLEDSTTESATIEAHGIKVEIRYTVASGCSYTVTSNPYRSTSEATMGWARTKTDLIGRVIEVQTFGGSGLPAPWGSNSTSTGTATTAYDAEFTTVTDQAGKVRRSRTNGLGQLARVDEPTASGLGTTSSPNQPTNYTYDALSNLVRVEQGSQNRYFMYDSLSRLRRARNPEQDNSNSTLDLSDPVTSISQWSMGYRYDDKGNVMVKTDARTVSTHISYDELNRPTRRWYNSSDAVSSTTHASPALPSNVGATDETKYFYDSQSQSQGQLPSGAPAFTSSYSRGRLIATTYGAGSSAGDYWSYDALGRPTLKIQQLGGINYQLERSYNRAGAPTSQTYPSVHTVTYAYDNAGRTSTMSGTLGDGISRTYTTVTLYSPWGGLSREHFGTDTILYHKQYYTNRGQFCDTRVSTVNDDWNWNRGAIVNYYSLTNFSQCGTGSDTNGNLYVQQHFVPHDNSISAYTVHQQNYAYDELNRLSWVGEYLNGATNTGAQSYLYDRFGNRRIDPASWGTGINNKQFDVTSSTNRLSVPGNQTGTMSYDSNGNLITDTYSGAGSRTYDGENRIVSAQGGSQGGLQYYTYDGAGQRVRRKVDGVETWQVYGFEGELVSEYPMNSGVTYPQKEYGYRNGQLLVSADAPANMALAANNATASASSSYSGWGASATTNGDRKGLNTWQNGVWSTASAGFPAWLQIDFNNSKTISEIDVFTEQDNYTNPSEPTETMTFSSYGLTGYDVQYWNGSSWVTITGGSVTSNNKVWRKFSFSAITTSKIRVLSNASPDGYSRLTEVEAWGYSSGASTLNWLISDHLGTPRMIFDKTGDLANVKRHDYLPFGEELFAGAGGRTSANGYASDLIRQKFTQYERDHETKLDFAQARYHSSEQGRFTSIDPLQASASIGEPQSFNRYSYSLNSPTNLTDPSGMLSMNGTSAMGQFARNWNTGPGVSLFGQGVEQEPTGPWEPWVFVDAEITGFEPPANPPQGALSQVRGRAKGVINPCYKVTADQLDFSREHFTERHILDDDPAYADRSKYTYSELFALRLVLEPRENWLKLARQMVIDYDKWTFQFGGKYQSSPGSNIVFVFGFPSGPAGNMEVKWFTGLIGKGQPNAGTYTNVNTLILGPDCRTVITSHPGLPNGSYNYGGTPPYYRKP
jgi:RHS repeat-associated protein